MITYLCKNKIYNTEYFIKNFHFYKSTKFIITNIFYYKARQALIFIYAYKNIEKISVNYI